MFWVVSARLCSLKRSHGHDDGIYRAQRPVQVLVCRSTSNSLHSAQRALQYTPTAGVAAGSSDRR
ncbi:hypothetical protein [Pseudonocardia sp. Ae707_Ps2]|uniref:hypothetical protein n=1 Tax=Pseudonocardia sp. Ae707_Ps2 TaxID=2212992 RepID=UPI00307F5CDD